MNLAHVDNLVGTPGTSHASSLSPPTDVGSVSASRCRFVLLSSTEYVYLGKASPPGAVTPTTSHAGGPAVLWVQDENGVRRDCTSKPDAMRVCTEAVPCQGHSLMVQPW